ncbi:tripartite tricarboxylate transporter substrate binding protein [Variovorax sp. TBS-050B]|uniref:Bug family tripartite tricarboxylate transporter substrate binding protein n=1 Tax=Variovorax sp. TBS-050B TaxID=2940551 RepID=UPI00247698C7|nr:tripartite tricarboxylate transporter substrate binding protein [Variovorax sp. TBS-050B]
MAALLFAWAGVSPVLAAEPFPSRPIRLVVPFGTGGPTDLVARGIATKMSASLGQPVHVENRAGAGGAIGADAVAKARPDGYTIGIATASTHEFTPACSKEPPYHPVNDFEMVGLIATAPTLVLVKGDAMFTSFAELIAASRKEPERYTWGTPGVCSNAHFLVEMLNRSGGGRILPVPYRGNNQATLDLIAGRVTLASDAVTTVSMGFIASGAVRPIAIIGKSGLDALRGVPTFADQGFDVGAFNVWQGLVAPAKTPADVVGRLNAALRDALQDAALQQRWLDDGVTPSPDLSPAAMKAQIQAGYENARRLAEALGLAIN